MESSKAGLQIAQERRKYKGTGGLSENNGSLGFWPAFLDQSTHCIHLSRTADGQPAPYHCLAGLPDALIVARDPQGRVTAVCPDLVSGFVRDGKFYTRAEAAASAERAAKPSYRRSTARSNTTATQSVPQGINLANSNTTWAGMLLQSSFLTLQMSWSMACLPFNLASSWSSLAKSTSTPSSRHKKRQNKSHGDSHRSE